MGLFDFLKGDKKPEAVTISNEVESIKNRWGSKGRGNGQFNCPIDIAVDPDGIVYVADKENRRIQVFTGDGTFLRNWGSYAPKLAISPFSRVYVAYGKRDYYSYQIGVFTSNGTLVGGWQTKADIQDIAVAPNGNIYVSGYTPHGSDIQVYTGDGTLVREFAVTANNTTAKIVTNTGDSYYIRVLALAVDFAGNLFLLSGHNKNRRIIKFSSDGTYITKWGDEKVIQTPCFYKGKKAYTAEWHGSDDGQFLEPNGIAVDAEGYVYVNDEGNQRIQVFTNNGVFITKWQIERDIQFNDNIAVGATGIVYMNDYENHCIHKINKEKEIRSGLMRIQEDIIKLNKEASIYSDEGKYDQAIDCYNRALEFDPNNDNILQKRNELVDLSPEISIAFSKTSLNTNKWEQVDLILTNNGRITGENISVSFSNVADIRRNEAKYTIKKGESVTDALTLKSDAHGRAPLVVTVKGDYFGGRTFEETSTIWLDISEPGTISAPGLAGSAPSTSPPDSPSLFAKYQSYDLIGEGGFGRVYRASRDGKVYAVKVPKTHDSATGKTFISEIQNWTRLNHPNIVRVFDYNILPTPYFEMEYCKESLDSLPKPMSPDQAAWLIYGVCSGLNYAHSQKIIHRDLKPQNILIKEGIPKITDWGLSKVLSESKSTTSTSFTPYYAAPEQMGSQPKDERTDIWQLGAILYELVTGTVPFTGESMMEVMMGIMSRDPVKPTDLNPDAKELEPVILRCLEKDPAKRFGLVTELQRVLAFYLKITYTEALKKSQGSDDRKSAYLCGELLIIHLDSGELPKALVYGKDLIRYLSGENRGALESLVEQMSFCIDEGLDDLPEELMRKAEWIVHGSRLEGMG